jgi:hypothetical protein
MGFKGFIATLYSPSFQTFISRRIAGGIYIGLVWIVTAIGLLGTLSSIYQALQGNAAVALLILVVAPLACFAAIVVLRLAFESSLALIVIAENSSGGLVPNRGARIADADFSAATNGWEAPKSPLIPTASPVYPSSKATYSNEADVPNSRDVKEMVDDYESDPESWAADILEPNELSLWRAASRPDLRPWIRASMPDFARWLRQ